MTDVFRVLAEPSRRHLLDALRDGERSVTELVTDTHLAQPAVSKHLRILRDAGVVSLRTSGRRHLYSIRPRSLREIADWLSYYQRFWGEGLSRMDEALRDSPRRGPGRRR